MEHGGESGGDAVAAAASKAAGLPLEQRRGMAPNGIEMPLLDQCWVTTVDFLPYTSAVGGVDLKQRRDMLTYMIRDVSWLLRLPYARFWSQVVFDDSLHGFLNSYLQEAPRPYDVDYAESLPEELLKQEATLAHKVFLVLVRMATHKESATDFMSPEAFAELIYNNWLFDVPKIFDLCAIYLLQNQELVARMVRNIFSRQPAYRADLREAFGGVVAAVQHATTVVTRDDDKSVTERLIYATDVCATLESFLRAFPDCYREAQPSGVMLAPAAVYDGLLAELRERCRLSSSGKLGALYARALRISLRTLRTVVTQLFLLPLQSLGSEDAKGPQQAPPPTRDELESALLALLHDVLRYERFSEQLRRHDTMRDILAQLEAMGVERTQLGFIRSTLVNDEIVDAAAADAADTLRDRAGKSKAGAGSAAGGGSKSAGAGKKGWTEADVQQVLAIMPDLGRGFIHACLDAVGNAETMINMLLEDQLPASVKSLPRDMSEAAPALEEENVFGHAQAPMPAIDIKRLHRGKKDKRYDEQAQLDADDKAELVRRYGYVSVEKKRPPPAADGAAASPAGAAAGFVCAPELDETFRHDDDDALVYEDEYDDTYDDLGQEGTLEPNTEDEMEANPNRRKMDSEEKEEGGEEEAADDEPSDMTGQAAPAYNPRGRGRGRGGRGGGRGGGDGEAETGSRYAAAAAPRGRGGRNTGEPASRGRGAVSEPWLVRRKKESNKAKYANHNRKDGALRKFNRAFGSSAAQPPPPS